MNLKKLVFSDCSKLLEPKYKWLFDRYQSEPYPRFKIPADPTKDISRISGWISIVIKESKGFDLGDCGHAIQFRDEGQKVYRTNIYALKESINEKGEWYIQNKPSENDVKISIERWLMLEDACYVSRKIMRALYLN